MNLNELSIMTKRIQKYQIIIDASIRQNASDNDIRNIMMILYGGELDEYIDNHGVERILNGYIYKNIMDVREEMRRYRRQYANAG
jgi:hypothetical protein